ncbi:hypothetical protein K8I28_08750, partial [bacterium]|nr:hypothetical protein [bacterium]
NGHWAISDTMWKVMKGKKPYLLNRQPLSVHKRFAQEHGFEIISLQPKIREDGLSKEKLLPAFQFLTEEDMVTSGVHLLARKK